MNQGGDQQSRTDLDGNNAKNADARLPFIQYSGIAAFGNLAIIFQT